MLIKDIKPVYTAYDRLVEKRRQKTARAAAAVKAAYERKHGKPGQTQERSK